MYNTNVDTTASGSERHSNYPTCVNKQACSNAKGTIACGERELKELDIILNIASQAYDFIKMKANCLNLITFCGTGYLIINCLRRINKLTCVKIPSIASPLENSLNNCEKTGQSKTTLNKEQTSKRLNQSTMISVKSPYGDGRGFVVGLSPKEPMYLMASINAKRFYSTARQPIKPDEVVILRKKVERLAKLWEASYIAPNKIYYDLKGYLKDINI
jgi:hypothetical protein